MDDTVIIPDTGHILKKNRTGYHVGMQIGAEEVISLEEAGKRIGLSPDTLRRAAQRGTLGATKIGKTWLTTTRALARYERENKGKPGRKPRRADTPE